MGVFLDSGSKRDGAGASTTGQTPHVTDALATELEEKYFMYVHCNMTFLIIMESLMMDPLKRTT